MRDNVSIIILAGGKGTRMESDEPKALSELAGKSFLAHILYTIKKYNAEIQPIIVVGYKKERIYDVIGKNYTYAVQEEQLGTGHAVKITKDLLENKKGSVVILYADHPMVSTDTLDALVKKEQETKSPIVMATTKVPNYKGWYGTFLTWGRIFRNSMGDIIKNVEYKDATEEERKNTEVNPCFFAFDREWLFEHLEKLSNKNAQQEYYLTDLIKSAFEEGYLIPSVSIPPEEAIGANSKHELEILETIYKKNKS